MHHRKTATTIVNNKEEATQLLAIECLECDCGVQIENRKPYIADHSLLSRCIVAQEGDYHEIYLNAS